MAISLEIETKKFVRSLSTISRKDKIFIAESIEKDLLSEWDNYEESQEVKTKVKEAFTAYQTGDVINLKDI